jgi:hypothetical protein
MDLNIALNRVHPGATYKLSKADPPHEVIEWSDVRKQPTSEELQKVWDDYLLEQAKKETKKQEIISKGKSYYAYRNGEIEELILIETKEVQTL